MCTENLHLEQERTKFSYQDRHNLNCPLCSILPQVGAGLQHDGLGAGGGRWRYHFCRPEEGAGSILARGCCVITVSSSSLGHPLYWGPP